MVNNSGDFQPSQNRNACAANRLRKMTPLSLTELFTIQSKNPVKYYSNASTSPDARPHADFAIASLATARHAFMSSIGLSGLASYSSDSAPLAGNFT
jgi:hypothetical protein